MALLIANNENGVHLQWSSEIVVEFYAAVLLMCLEFFDAKPTKLYTSYIQCELAAVIMKLSNPLLPDRCWIEKFFLWVKTSSVAFLFTDDQNNVDFLSIDA